MTERLRTFVMGGSALWVALCALVVAFRISFPLELEWMEGGSLQHARWIQSGNPIYPAPGADFVPFLYTPLYPLVLAVLGWVFPLGFGLARTVSVLAWIAVGAGLWWAVRGEGKPRAHAAAAVGLLCAGYVFSYRWLDVGRGDTLFAALVVWSLVLLRHSRGNHRRAAAAGLLMALAFWTKQTAFLFVLASGLGALVVAPRQLLVHAAVIAVIDGGGALVGNARSNGALWMYIYELHQTHAFNHERFRLKTWGMFTHGAPFLVTLFLWRVVALVRAGARQIVGPRDLMALPDPVQGQVYWAIMAVTGLLVSALGYSTQWAEPNAFIPGVIFGALFLTVALPQGGWAEQVGLWLVLAQLVFALVVEPRYQPIQDRGLSGLAESYQLQDPARTIPSAEARQRASALAEDLRSGSGAVFALHRPWWALMRDPDGFHVGSMGVRDVRPDDGQRIRAEVRRRIRDGLFAEIWLEGEPPSWLRRELARGYRLERRLTGSQRVRPMTGYMSDAGMVTAYRRPQLMFVPAAPLPRPAGARVIADFERGGLRGWRRSGDAFGTRPARPLSGKLPAVGPHSDAYLLSSASSSGRRELTGAVTSDPFPLEPGDRVQLWMGATSPRAAVAVELLGSDDSVQARLEPVGKPMELEPRVLDWTPPATMEVRVRVVDDDPEHAVFVDDVVVQRTN